MIGCMKCWDVLIFHSVLSLFKTTQSGILLMSERPAKTFLCPHIQHSPSRQVEPLLLRLLSKLPVVPKRPETGGLWDPRSLITAGLSHWAPLNLHSLHRRVCVCNIFFCFTVSAGYHWNQLMTTSVQHVQLCFHWDAYSQVLKHQLTMKSFLMLFIIMKKRCSKHNFDP